MVDQRLVRFGCRWLKLDEPALALFDREARRRHQRNQSRGKKEGSALVLLEDDKGNKLVAGNTKPLKVVC